MTWRLGAVVSWWSIALLAACGGGSTPQPSLHYETDSARLTIEVATDELVHFEFATRGAAAAAIDTSPMIERRDYPGPRHFTDDGRGKLETAALALAIDRSSLCISVTDRRRSPAMALTTICPAAVGEESKSLTLSSEGTAHLYGLGEHFFSPNEPNGDLLDRTVKPGSAVGNDITPFNGGNTGNAQFPVLYALGGDGQSYALFLDQQYAQEWNLAGDPWQVTMTGGVLRGYFIGGRDLLAVRQNYMELVGRPPVPPKKMFGLWVSEFGFDKWAELEDKLGTLRAGGFPVDGFVLDLQWFGGVFRRPSYMGELRFDETRFPDPALEIARLRDEQGVGVMVIEEPYVDRSRPVYDDLATRSGLVRACEGCAPADLLSWWGQGGMVDFTSQAAGDYWHDVKRQPLVAIGVLGHWTDLGEPERFFPGAFYAGFPALGLHAEPDVHNLYNFDWVASIERGYTRNHTAARPFVLSRSGTSGLQRFGAAMWSGDIGSNMTSLATQLDVSMHMSFSGMDYFGSDVGGYLHGAPDGDPDELYTTWLADSAFLDVPLRPHTENLCNCRQTAPDRIGDPASNLENLRLRYRLLPYFYSLAHRAYRYGEPLVAPLVVYFPDDPMVRELGDERLLGRDLLVAAVSSYDASARDVYLPAGTWIDFRTHAWLDSAGGSVQAPVRSAGHLQLPLYARAGAIIPEMYVDEQTMNALGQRLDGSRRDELVVRVYADERPTRFTLFEDDGATIAYQRGEVRTTDIAQQRDGEVIRVTIEPVVGSYAGAPAERDNVLELVARDVNGSEALAVTLNGVAVARAQTRLDFDQAAGPSWYAAGDGLLLLRSGTMAVAQRKEFALR